MAKTFRISRLNVFRLYCSVLIVACHVGTCLGILANDGIVLAAEKRNVHKLLDEVFLSDKIYVLDDNIACSVAGITSDANVLVTDLRKMAQRLVFD